MKLILPVYIFMKAYQEFMPQGEHSVILTIGTKYLWVKYQTRYIAGQMLT